MSISSITSGIPQSLPIQRQASTLQTSQTNGLNTPQNLRVTGGLSGQVPQPNVINGLNGTNALNGINGINGINSVNGVNNVNGANGLNSLAGTAGTQTTLSPAELFRTLMVSLLSSLAQNSGNQQPNIFNSSLTGDGSAQTLANCPPGTETGSGTGTGTESGTGSTPTTEVSSLGQVNPNATFNPTTPLIPNISPTNPTTFNPFTQARIA